MNVPLARRAVVQGGVPQGMVSRGRVALALTLLDVRRRAEQKARTSAELHLLVTIFRSAQRPGSK